MVAHLALLRVNSWHCTLGSLLDCSGEQYEMPGMKSESFACKSNTLSNVLISSLSFNIQFSKIETYQG